MRIPVLRYDPSELAGLRRWHRTSRVTVTFLNKAHPEGACAIPANTLLANTESNGDDQLPEKLGSGVSTSAAKREELEVSDILPNLHFVGFGR